jgi:hypothetical protein
MGRFSPRPPASLSPTLQKRINAYALAATAAGTGVLAFAQSAEGKIVYTPANIKIVANHGLFTFDLNHDGTPDFGLSNRTFATSFRNVYGTLVAHGEKSANRVWNVLSRTMNAYESCAAALPKGKKIGSQGEFGLDPKLGLVMAEVYNSSIFFGPWLKVKESYLGLKFAIKGKTHYGWARVSVNINRTNFKATITGYAYETIANKAIIAGKTTGQDVEVAQPATLGRLAQGAAGGLVSAAEQ